MKINLPLMSQNQNANRQQPQFKGTDYYMAVKFLKDIPCASCGIKTINPTEYTQAFTKLCKSLTEMIKLGKMDSWRKFPKIWEVLTSMAQKYPRTSLDRMLLDNNFFNGLKSIMLETPELMESFTRTSMTDRQKGVAAMKNLRSDGRAILKKSSIVVPAFVGFKNCLSDTQKSIYEQLQIYAKKYPNLTLSEIFNLPQVRDFHRLKNSLQMGELREKINYHYSNINDIVAEIKPEAVEEINELKNDVNEIYRNTIDEQVISNEVKNLYKSALEKLGISEVYDKVEAEIDQFPTNFYTKDSFVACHNNSTDEKIIDGIFVGALSTFEHIIPKADGGKDDYSNGLAFHKYCNNKRGRIKYEDYAVLHPDFAGNIQKQADFICDAVLRDELPFQTLPLKLAKTISKYTGGKIKIDVKDFCKKSYDKHTTLLEETKSTLNNNINKRNEHIREKIRLTEELNRLKDELDEKNASLEQLSKEIVERRNRCKQEEILVNVFNRHSTESTDKNSEIQEAEAEVEVGTKVEIEAEAAKEIDE